MKSMKWNRDNTLTVTSENQAFNETSGGMDREILGEITESAEWWLETAVTVLKMLPGKPNEDGTGYLFGPADADPDMIGELVAAMLKERP